MTMKREMIGIRLTPEMKEKLQKVADKEMRSLSNLVLKILTEYLAEQEKKPKK